MKTSRVMRLALLVLTLSAAKFCAHAALKGKPSLCQPISQSVNDFNR
jgi:hypothetical protein